MNYLFTELIISLEKQKVRHQAETKRLSEQVNSSLEEWKEIKENFQKQLMKTL
jgi:hypothetical protein